jgi:hypothetical protein
MKVLGNCCEGGYVEQSLRNAKPEALGQKELYRESRDVKRMIGCKDRYLVVLLGGGERHHKQTKDEEGCSAYRHRSARSIVRICIWGSNRETDK